MAQVDFHFAGHVIRVEGPAPTLAWLEEFLSPQFPVSDGIDPHRTIRFIANAQEYGELLARGPHSPARLVECFTLDGGILSATRWNAPDDNGLVVFDERARVFYRQLRGAPGSVEAVAPADGGPARGALMRIVREFAMMFAARAGWLLVHGAAVQVGDGAVVIAGPKKAGKTTLLLQALLNEGGAYIANDRVAIQLAPRSAFVHGIPTIVSLRARSVAWFPALEAALTRSRYNSRLLLRDCELAATSAPPDRPEKWSLSPAQLSHAVGAESRATGGVSALLFPRVMEPPAATALEKLSPDRALAALRDVIFRPFPQAGMFRIEGMPHRDAAEHLLTLMTRLTATVPSFSCQLGADAYTGGSTWLGRLADGHAHGPLHPESGFEGASSVDRP